jgi:O-antigen ligase
MIRTTTQHHHPTNEHSRRSLVDDLLVLGIRILLVAPFFLPVIHMIGILLVPTLGILSPIQATLALFQKAMLFQISVTLAVVAYAVLIYRDPRWTPYWSRIHSVLIAFGLLLVVTGVTSPDPWLSILGTTTRPDGLLFLAHILACAFLMSWMIPGRGALTWMLGMTVMSGALLTLTGIAMVVLSPPFRDLEFLSITLNSSFGNLSFLAHAFVLLICANIYLITTRRKWWDWATFALLTLGVFLTTSSAAIMVTSLIVLGVAWNRSRWLAYSLIVITSTVALVLTLTTHPDLVSVRVTSLRDSTVIRLQTWSSATETILRSRPGTGYGWGNGAILWNDARRDVFASAYRPYDQVVYDRMHNALIEHLAAAGVVGAVAFLSLWVWLIRMAGTKLLRTKDPIWMFFTLTLSVEFVLIFWSFDMLFSYLIMAMVIGGLIRFAAQQQTLSALTHPRVRAAILLASSISAAVLLLSVSIPAYRAARARSVAETAFATPKNERTAEWSMSVLAMIDRTQHFDHPYESLNTDISDTLEKLLTARYTDDKLSGAIYERLVALSLRLQQTHPLNPIYPAQLGHIESTYPRQYSRAIAQLVRARTLAPSSGFYRFKHAVLALESGDPQTAFRIFAELSADQLFVPHVRFLLASENFLNLQFEEGERRVDRVLASYSPTAAEWDSVISSYRDSQTDRMRTLSWLRRMLGLTSTTTTNTRLAEETIELARSLDQRKDVALLIAWLRDRGYTAYDTLEGVSIRPTPTPPLLQ